MGQREAARAYDVPIETLRRQVVSIDCQSGSAKLLTVKWKRSLLSWILCLDGGYGVWFNQRGYNGYAICHFRKKQGITIHLRLRMAMQHEDCMKALCWWRREDVWYPTTAQVARKHLSICGTSVPLRDCSVYLVTLLVINCCQRMSINSFLAKNMDWLCFCTLHCIIVIIVLIAINNETIIINE